MHSPLDNSELETFFQHLNAPLKQMPPQERAELHLEVRQHLDGLAAAHEELGLSHEEALTAALRSFGDPRRIGKRMYWEWCRGRWRGVSDEMKAVLSMLGLLIGAVTLMPLLTLGLFWIPYCTWHWTPEVDKLLDGLVLVGAPTLAGGLLGRKRPKHAVTGAFYATIALTAPPLLVALGCYPLEHDLSPLVNVSLWAGVLAGVGVRGGIRRQPGARRAGAAAVVRAEAAPPVGTRRPAPARRPGAERGAGGGPGRTQGPASS